MLSAKDHLTHPELDLRDLLVEALKVQQSSASHCSRSANSNSARGRGSCLCRKELSFESREKSGRFQAKLSPIASDREFCRAPVSARCQSSASAPPQPPQSAPPPPPAPNPNALRPQEGSLGVAAWDPAHCLDRESHRSRGDDLRCATRLTHHLRDEGGSGAWRLRIGGAVAGSCGSRSFRPCFLQVGVRLLDVGGMEEVDPEAFLASLPPDDFTQEENTLRQKLFEAWRDLTSRSDQRSSASTAVQHANSTGGITRIICVSRAVSRRC